MEITLEGNTTVVRVNGVTVSVFDPSRPVPPRRYWYEPQRGPLEREGVPHEFIKISGGEHRFDANMNDPRTVRAFEQVLSFLKEHLR